MRDAVWEIIERLAEAGGASDEAVGTALVDAEASGAPAERVAISRGLVGRGEFYAELSSALGTPYHDLAVSPPEAGTGKLVDLEFAIRHRCVPVSSAGGTVVLAMADPTDMAGIDGVRMSSGMPVTAVLSAGDDVDVALDAWGGCEVEAAVAALADTVDQDSIQDAMVRAEPLASCPADLSAAEELLVSLFERAVLEGASDVHIEPMESSVRVRFRVDGMLRETLSLPKDNQPRLVSSMKTLAGMDISESRKPQDGHFTATVGGTTYDFRSATLPTVFGEHVTNRILRRESVLTDMESLGFLPDSLALFSAACDRPYGTVLVTGPTGSGKTTTLYSALHRLNTGERHIVTAENPVEYRVAGITQCQVDPSAGFTFATALRSFLRSDPNVMLVGEIRDGETADIAMEAALTGHLVFSTLHANDAVTAIPRLLDIGVPPYVASSALDFVLAQRLARRLCPACSAPFPEHPGTMSPVGCDECGGTGYSGRVGIYECLPISQAFRDAIARSAPAGELRAIAVSEGMATLREDGMAKAAAGITSVAEVLRVTA